MNNNTARTLLQEVHSQADTEGKRFLNNAFGNLTTRNQAELKCPLPVPELEYQEVEKTWIKKLKIIESALESFLTLKGPIRQISGSPTSWSPAQKSTSIAASSGSSHQTAVSGSLLQPVATRHKSSVLNCLRRDGGTCRIIGHKLLERFPVQMANIIPFAQIKGAECCQLNFWKMLELFFGVESTNSLFNTLYKNINHLTNLIILDNSIHAIIDNSNILLTPFTDYDQKIGILGNNYMTNYYLKITYPMERFLPLN